MNFFLGVSPFDFTFAVSRFSCRGDLLSKTLLLSSVTCHCAIKSSSLSVFPLVSCFVSSCARGEWALGIARAFNPGDTDGATSWSFDTCDEGAARTDDDEYAVPVDIVGNVAAGRVLVGPFSVTRSKPECASGAPGPCFDCSWSGGRLCSATDALVSAGEIAVDSSSIVRGEQVGFVPWLVCPVPVGVASFRTMCFEDSCGDADILLWFRGEPGGVSKAITACVDVACRNALIDFAFTWICSRCRSMILLWSSKASRSSGVG